MTAGECCTKYADWCFVYAAQRSYGIPTKDRELRTLPLPMVGVYVAGFLNDARQDAAREVLRHGHRNRPSGTATRRCSTHVPRRTGKLFAARGMESMSTNADRPFAPGERVQWKQYVATVVSNDGESGLVEIKTGTSKAAGGENGGASVKAFPPLLDAAGNIIPVNTCGCGRPKVASTSYCCGHCSVRVPLNDFHSTACNLRCATLGISGFSTRLVPEHEVPGEPVYVPAKKPPHKPRTPT